MKRHLEIQIAIVFSLFSVLFSSHAVFAQQTTEAVVAPAETQIVGGQVAERGEYPWQAMLFNPNGMFVCSGSLIRNNWVLTAAHCLDDAGIARVTLGGYNAWDSSETTRQTFAVKSVIIHPEFNAVTLVNDIGLIELDGNATLNEYVQLISLVNSQDINLVQPGTDAIVSGWGATQEGGWVSATLNEVTVPIVSHDVCAQAYGSQLQDGMVCAGYAEGGMDSCSGDSGGPLVVSDGADGWKLAGVVSWGRGCARADAYGVYTDPTFFGTWIAKHLGSHDNGQSGSNSSNSSDSSESKQQNESQSLNLVFLPVVANQ